MKSWNSLFDDKNEDLLKVIENLLKASNPSDARRMLEQHPELLSE